MNTLVCCLAGKSILAVQTLKTGITVLNRVRSSEQRGHVCSPASSKTGLGPLDAAVILIRIIHVVCTLCKVPRWVFTGQDQSSQRCKANFPSTAAQFQPFSNGIQLKLQGVYSVGSP